MNDWLESVKNNLGEYVWLYNGLGDYESKKILKEIVEYVITLDNKALHGLKDSRFSMCEDLDLLAFNPGGTLVNIQSQYETLVEDYMQITQMNYQDIVCYTFVSADKGILKDVKRYQLYPNVQVQMCEKTDMAALCLDEALSNSISVLKVDAKGAEESVLLKAQRQIAENKPQLVIVLDYNYDNLWRIANVISNMNEDYKIFLRYYGEGNTPDQLVLYAG